MSFVTVNHPNGRTVRVVRVPESTTETPMTPDDELIIALGARVAELERGEYICKSCGIRKDSDHPQGDF